MRHETDTPDDVLLSLTSSDPEALGVFYDRYYSFVNTLFVRRVPIDVVPDLVAETFAAALRCSHRYNKNSGNATQWLSGIARNLVSHYFRNLEASSRNLKKLGADLTVLQKINLASLNANEEDSRIPALTAALSQLSPKLAAAVRMRVIDELDFAEIAQKLDCSEVTARVRVHRGLSYLENELSSAS